MLTPEFIDRLCVLISDINTNANYLHATHRPLAFTSQLYSMRGMTCSRTFEPHFSLMDLSKTTSYAVRACIPEKYAFPLLTG